jgi:hypothetical protein
MAAVVVRIVLVAAVARTALAAAGIDLEAAAVVAGTDHQVAGDTGHRGEAPTGCSTCAALAPAMVPRTRTAERGPGSATPMPDAARRYPRSGSGPRSHERQALNQAFTRGSRRCSAGPARSDCGEQATNPRGEYGAVWLDLPVRRPGATGRGSERPQVWMPVPISPLNPRYGVIGRCVYVCSGSPCALSVSWLSAVFRPALPARQTR